MGRPKVQREKIGSIYIPPSVCERLRMHCAHKRMSLSEAVSEALILWLPIVEKESA